MASKKFSSLTPEEQKAELAKQLLKQQRLAITDFAFGRLKTWADVEATTGFKCAGREGAVSAEGIRGLFAEQIAGLDKPAVTPEPEPVVTEPAPEPTSELPADSSTSEGIACLRKNPVVKYVKFQERAAEKIIHNLTVLNHPVAGLTCRAGGGKTFILGAVIVELWRRQWPVITETLSPFPVVYVTRASIVEKTVRDLRDGFGLRIGVDVDVTNIDQFRCKFGKIFYEEKVVNHDGVEQVSYEWNPFNAPGLIILDESHYLKNSDSTQSKIFQGYNELDGQLHRQIFSSATPWARVSDCKCFAVATRLEF